LCGGLPIGNPPRFRSLRKAFKSFKSFNRFAAFKALLEKFGSNRFIRFTLRYVPVV
jgi:hypothetical protein